MSQDVPYGWPAVCKIVSVPQNSLRIILPGGHLVYMRAKTKPKREVDWPSYDAVAKDLIQRDRPTLLTELTGGRAIKQTLNVEFAVVEQRRADLLFELDDDSLFLLDCQSENDDEMEYRIGIYNLIGAQKYRRKIWPTVLYMGMAPMRMKDSLDAGGTTVKYNLVDIRAIDAAALLKSGSPGDWALAILAKGGLERLREILAKAMGLAAGRRDRMLVQVCILAGLRKASGKVKMEVKRMGGHINIQEHEFLRDIWNDAKVEGAIGVLRDLVEQKFGPLPAWAASRLKDATPEQIAVWSRKVLNAGALEGIIGRK